MYKHKILETLSAFIRKAQEKDDKNVLNAMYETVSKSQEFYIGDISSQFNQIKKGRDLYLKNRILNIETENVKMPYNNILLDFSIKNTCREEVQISYLLVKHNNGYYGGVFRRDGKLFGPEVCAVRIINSIPKIIILAKNADESAVSDAEITVSAATFYAQQVLKIISAKNVFFEFQEPEGMAARNRKRKKKGQHLLEKYHVLKFCPGGIAKKKANGEGIGVNLGTMPVHLCRGHFKVFTAEKPLLGKWAGVFWWQPQVRGNKKNGVVVKDYELVTA